MKLLLDENLPIKLKLYFSDNYLVFTSKEMQWVGKKNGELLQLMAENGIDALVTIDKNLKFQQNLDKYNIQIIILLAFNNKLQTLIPFIEPLEKDLSLRKEQKIIEITA